MAAIAFNLRVHAVAHINSVVQILYKCIDYYLSHITGITVNYMMILFPEYQCNNFGRQQNHLLCFF